MARPKKTVAEPKVKASKVEKAVEVKEEVIVEAVVETVEAVTEKILEINKTVIAEKSSLESLKDKIVSKARFILQTIRG